ncbi:3'(2'),5'-bisphosphate nucleotidase CysQ [Kordiimonas sp. SCSIO 12610]|uniref:3'(2'),5'-bisphosphate nucleotidase CysQ n=1 Tax=Kordiimonas sp. SCSIO 12610 TaxID=2829597 RepID=UPI00210C8CA1|nr:3'(2'),5'-bisphosphate nucleotidase CysQ [Kordiimonas sp. SCSIO 12610]UTW54554.1 3'(2'),5'-bisphosphate nucleotidase CysQ [Kordiimonas sp. SCSIO 12610]
MTIDLATFVEPLTSTILDAGKKVMDVYGTDFDVYGKDDNSPVTEADRQGEIVITKALEQLAPDIPIVGEEAKSEGMCPDISQGTFWLVDPLDGTKEFIKKGNDFTVNIGLIIDNQPVLGFVLAPALNKLYWGIVGTGAWMADAENGAINNIQPIQTRKVSTESLVIVASKSHRSLELETWLSNYPMAEHTSIGSSLKFCLIATGEADLYPRLGPTCEWDTAAAHAVLLAAGGSVDAPDGKPLQYGKDPNTFLNPYFICKGDPATNTPSL